MTAQFSIDAKAFELRDILKDFYHVPSFQREYIWKAQNVETMLNDIWNEFDRQNNRRNDKPAEYFLGSIVVCPSENDPGTLDLIDGQQRMTTLFLMLCAVRDFLEKTGNEVPDSLKQQIRSSTPQRGGGEIHRPRVELHYEDGSKLIKRISNQESAERINVDEELANNGLSNSVKNLLGAYRAINDFLAEKFSDAQEVESFWSQMVYDVKLIRISTPDLTRALQIFETINERGVGLNAMDLLKNLLFMKADRSLAETIGKKWKNMVDKLERKEKPLRFLRYFVLSQYDVDPEIGLTENEIFQWFQENESQHRIDKDPMAFLERLVEYSEVYLNFVDNRDPDGNHSKYLSSLSSATSSSARQHFILLMAAKSLPRDLFNKLCLHLENTLFVYLITRQRTNVLESNVTRWAQNIRAVRDQDELNSFLHSFLFKDLQKRMGDFERAFMGITLGKVPKYRIRYTLGKIIKHIDESAGRTERDLSSLAPKSATKSSPHIEHIMPISSLDSSDSYDIDHEMVNSLGNLTLLEPTINTSAGDRPYFEKVEYYQNSDFLLNKSMKMKPQLGTNTQFNRGTARLMQFQEWNETSIRKRHEMLKDIALEVWMGNITR